MEAIQVADRHLQSGATLKPRFHQRTLLEKTPSHHVGVGDAQKQPSQRLFARRNGAVLGAGIGSRSDQVAPVQEDHLVGQLFELVQHMAGNQHPRAGVAERTKYGDRLGARLRVESVQRFVQNQQGWIVSDREGHLDPLPHALAISGHQPVASGRQAHSRQRLLRTLSRHRFGQAAGVQAILQEAPAGDAGWKRVRLRAIPHQAVEPLRRCRRRTMYGNVPAGRSQQTREQVHQRRFAGAVRANQAGDAFR